MGKLKEITAKDLDDTLDLLASFTHPIMEDPIIFKEEKKMFNNCKKFMKDHEMECLIAALAASTFVLGWAIGSRPSRKAYEKGFGAASAIWAEALLESAAKGDITLPAN